MAATSSPATRGAICSMAGRQRPSGGQCRRRLLVGQGGADSLILSGELNWVMDFESGAERFKVSGMTEAFRAAPARVGADLTRYSLQGPIINPCQLRRSRGAYPGAGETRIDTIAEPGSQRYQACATVLECASRLSCIEDWLCVEPVDFRKQIPGLAALVRALWRWTRSRRTCSCSPTVGAPSVEAWAGRMAEWVESLWPIPLEQDRMRGKPQGQRAGRTGTGRRCTGRKEPRRTS